MFKFILIYFFICGITYCGFSQTEKKIEIKNTTKRKLSFGEIEVQNQTSAVYKTLEVRYTLNTLTVNKEIIVNGSNYKMFSDRKSAITHYNKVKDTAAKKEIFYVTSLVTKTTEVFTFRVN